MSELTHTLEAAATLAAPIAVALPATCLAWQAVVRIGVRADMGQSPLGQRYLIPITGGVFWGAGDFANLRGQVLGGGADRQLHRTDGVRELDALYEMQTDSGELLSIRNRVLIDDTPGTVRYALSHIQVTAPQGTWDLLNRRIFVGTLHPLAAQHGAVLVRAYLLG